MPSKPLSQATAEPGYNSVDKTTTNMVSKADYQQPYYVTDVLSVVEAWRTQNLNLSEVLILVRVGGVCLPEYPSLLSPVNSNQV